MSNVRRIKTRISSLGEEGMRRKDIAIQLFGERADGSKRTASAAYQAMRYFETKATNESLSGKRAIRTFEKSEDATIIPQSWRNIGLATTVRDDRITWKELEYMAKEGRDDTMIKAQRYIERILKKTGGRIPDSEDTFERPMVRKKIRGEWINYRFGRGRADTQRAKVAKQLRAKGIRWSSEYADFAGYGG